MGLAGVGIMSGITVAAKNFVDGISKTLPKLAEQRKEDYLSLGLSEQDCDLLVSEKVFSGFFRKAGLSFRTAGISLPACPLCRIPYLSRNTELRVPRIPR